jgi:hypothetical protein
MCIYIQHLANKLHQWTKQKWRTASGKKSKGRLRYLPDTAWDTLSPEQIIRTNRFKREGFRQGKQWVKQPQEFVPYVIEQCLPRSRVKLIRQLALTWMTEKTRPTLERLFSLGENSKSLVIMIF